MQVVILSTVGKKQRMVRTTSGQTICADIADLKEVAKPFNDPAGSDEDDES
jgi:hypothetical protein